MGISFWQILIIVVIVIMLFGAKRIPDLGKSLGQAIRGFKKGISEDEIDVTDTVKSEQISDTDAEKSAQTNSEKNKA